MNKIPTQKKEMLKIGFIILVFFFVGNAKTKIVKNKTDGKNMYSRLFADCRNSSFQALKTDASGSKKWFKSSIDKNSYKPRLILTTAKGVLVQNRSSLELIDYNGNAVWQLPNDPEMNVFANGDLIYARDGARGIVILDFAGNEISKQRISTASMGAFIDFLFPFKETFLAQTFSRKLAAPGKPKKSISSFILMNQNRPVWIQKYSERHLPCLLTSDKNRLIVISNRGTIKILKPETGDVLEDFTLDGVGPLQASMDNSDNLILSAIDSKKNMKIINCSLKGDVNWEVNLPGGEVKPFCQPPGIGSNNWVYYIYNNSLFVLNSGQMEWKATVFQTDYYQYFTILGDNSVLTIGANRLQQISNIGDEKFTVMLPISEEISTPPVIDENGNIYFGTENGIYCFE